MPRLRQKGNGWSWKRERKFLDVCGRAERRMDVGRRMEKNGTMKEIFEVFLFRFELILVRKVLTTTSATFAEVNAPGRMCSDHSVYSSFIALAIPVSVFFASPKTIMVLSSKKS